VAITTNQFKNGNHIDVDGVVFKIIDFQHVKPGKGGAFVRTKLRRASDGAVIDRTFRAGEKFRAVRTETRKMQFLYADGAGAHFMDLSSYEQLEIPESTVASSLQWTRPNDEVEVLFIDDAPVDAIGSLGVRRSGGRILQLEQEVVGVAVVPALTGLERADDGVTRRVVVSRGVLSR